MNINPFRKGKLYGKRIAIVAADGFEYVELAIPSKALWLAGARREVISLHAGRIRGMNLTEPTGTVRVHHTFGTADPSSYDAVFIPGGFIGPDFLRQSAAARTFVRHFADQHKPIASLCHGPWLLASAELALGRTMTSWPGIRDDLVNAGATWLDQSIVVDRNLLTSRGPQDLLEFVSAIVEHFAIRAEMTDLGASPTTHASAPRRDHPLELAVKAARFLPGSGLRTLVAASSLAGLGSLVLRRAS